MSFASKYAGDAVYHYKKEEGRRKIWSLLASCQKDSWTAVFLGRVFEDYTLDL
jgi:hypothetical protein